MLAPAGDMYGCSRKELQSLRLLFIYGLEVTRKGIEAARREAHILFQEVILKLQSLQPMAEYHGAARAVRGCSIYVSKENLVGGYCDADDYVKFGWPMAFSVTLLGWSAIEYQSEVSSINQLGYVRTAIHWGTNFILQARSLPTTLYTHVGDGDDNHKCWKRPKDMGTARTLYKVTSDSSGTEAAAEAVAALSTASLGFKEVHLKYSSKLLRRSISIWDKEVFNGHVKPHDEDIQSSVLEIVGSGVQSTCITCPTDPTATLRFWL